MPAVVTAYGAPTAIEGSYYPVPQTTQNNRVHTYGRNKSLVLFVQEMHDPYKLPDLMLQQISSIHIKTSDSSAKEVNI